MSRRRMDGLAALRLVPLALLLALAAVTCGRTLAPGQEGELCGSDVDCGDGLVCERRVCLSLERLGAGSEIPTHSGVFFAVLHLDTWDGPDGESIRELGRFIGDLSTVRSPYYGLWAVNSEIARLGRLDPTTVPLDFAAGGTITDLDLVRQEDLFSATASVMFLPAVYSDDQVSLDFDIPLRDGLLTIAVAEGSEGTGEGSGEGTGDGGGGISGTGVLVLDGGLRESDARQLVIERVEGSFSLYDVLRNEPLTIDTDGDGDPDAWQLRWQGTALFE